LQIFHADKTRFIISKNLDRGKYEHITEIETDNMSTPCRNKAQKGEEKEEKRNKVRGRRRRREGKCVE
jgi:hypothetical protein